MPRKTSTFDPKLAAELAAFKSENACKGPLLPAIPRGCDVEKLYFSYYAENPLRLVSPGVAVVADRRSGEPLCYVCADEPMSERVVVELGVHSAGSDDDALESWLYMRSGAAGKKLKSYADRQYEAWLRLGVTVFSTAQNMMQEAQNAA